MPKSERTRKPDDANLVHRAKASDVAATDGSADHPIAARLNALQGAAGNRAVQRLVRASRAKPQPVQRLGEEDGYNLYQGIAPESSPAAAGAPASAATPSGYGQYASHLAPETPASPASAAAPSGYGQYAASMAPEAAASPASAAAPSGYGQYASHLAPEAPASAASAAAPSGYGQYASHLAPEAAASPASAAAPSGYGQYVSHMSPEAPASVAPAPPAAPASAAAPSGYGQYVSHVAPPGALAEPALASPDASAAAAAPPVTGPGGLAPLALPGKYKGEDKEVGWRAHFGIKPDAAPEVHARAAAGAKGTGIVTKYNTPEEQAANTLTPRAVDGGGSALTTASGDAASFRGEYAMGTGGEVVGNLGGQQWEMNGPQKRTIHHSTMMAGADVAHAGHIGVDQGQVNYLDDDSGHYRPDEAHTYAAFNELAGQGVLNPDSATGRVNLVDKSVDKGMGVRGPAASVHFSGYQQAQGNERGIRNKSALMGELLAKRQRYEGVPDAPPMDAPAAAPPPGAMELIADDALAAGPEAAPAPASAAAKLYDPAYVLSAEGGDPVAPAAAAAPQAPGSGYAGYAGYTPIAPEVAPEAPAAPASTPASAASPPGYGMYRGIEDD